MKKYLISCGGTGGHLSPGIALADMPGVHAITDVTGFGLAGHLLEVCRGSRLSAQVGLQEMPLITEAKAFAGQGIVTGASARNWAAYGADIVWPAAGSEASRALMSDPQTSGGLLVTCSQDSVAPVLAAFANAGFELAAVIGAMTESGGHSVVDFAA